ncbi:MAG: alpha/beta hydrolase [Vulcanimicrobiota bacterium]
MKFLLRLFPLILCLLTGYAGADEAGPVPIRVEPESTPSGEAAFLGPLRRVEVGDISIGFRQFGSGPPVVLVMGFSGTTQLWDVALLGSLAEEHQVTIFDNRGVNETTRGTAPLTMEQMADDTAGFLEAVAPEAVVVGWSMGGEIALTMLVRQPEACKAVIACGSDFGGPHALEPTEDVLAVLNDPEAPPEKLLALLFPDSPEGMTSLVRFARGTEVMPEGHLDPVVLQEQSAAEEAFAESSSTYDGLPQVQKPVIVVGGELDPVVPVGNAHLVAKRVPGARLEIFEGASHGMLFQDSERLVKLVRELTRD